MRIIDSYHENGKRSFMCFEDDTGDWYGLYQTWYENGQPKVIGNLDRNTFVGERIDFGEDGVVDRDVYLANGALIHDFLKNPISDEEKVLLVLKYGYPLIHKGDS